MLRPGNDIAALGRYQRQAAFEGLGPDGQRALSAGRVLIVGAGGLGSWTAELLARAGVGFLRLADADRVDLTNLHRQAMYDESDAAAGTAKVRAAAEHLRRINRTVRVELIERRLERDNAESLSADVDVIVDGTDNFATRFLLNDVAIKLRRPWVFGGVVGTQGQTMTIVPGRTRCLRCVLDVPPPSCQDPRCSDHGVLGPAVAAVAAIQAAEAVKILSGRMDDISGYLVKIDTWTNQWQRIGGPGAAARPGCPCCGQRDFEFLEP